LVFNLCVIPRFGYKCYVGGDLCMPYGWIPQSFKTMLLNSLNWKACIFAPYCPSSAHVFFCYSSTPYSFFLKRCLFVKRWVDFWILILVYCWSYSETVFFNSCRECIMLAICEKSSSFQNDFESCFSDVHLFSFSCFL
jgi:hypothetical protein